MLRGAGFRTPCTTNISHSKSYTSISTSNNASLKDKSLPYHVILSWRYPSSDGISENEKFREARNPRAHCSLAYNFSNLRQISWEGCRNIRFILTSHPSPLLNNPRAFLTSKHATLNYEEGQKKRFRK